MRGSLKQWLKAMFVTSLLLTSGAQAEISLQQQRPVASFHYILTEDASLRSIWDSNKWFRQGPSIGVQNNFLSNPLVLIDATGLKTVLVSYLNTLSLSAGYLLTENLFLGADFFAGVTIVPGSSARWGAGDTRLFAKYQLLGDVSGVAVALVPEFTFPTGTRTALLSQASFAPGFKVALEHDFGLVRAATSFGLVYYSAGIYQTIDYRIQAPISVGAQIPIGQWAVNIEGTTSLLFSGGFANGPDAVYAGGSYRIYPGAIASLGVSAGNFQTDGSASLGIVAGVKLLPLAKAPEGSGGFDCGETPVTGNFYARPLTSEERKRFTVLPYISTEKSAHPAHRHKITTLQLGEMTGMSKGVPYVDDGQILFAIDIVGLPARNTIVKSETLALKLDVRKVSKDNSNDTEIFCFLDPQVCSGEIYRHIDWQENINKNFFHGKETPNDYFARQYLDRVVGQTEAGNIYAADLTLDIRKLLENSVHQDPLDLLYGDADPMHAVGKRTLYMSVADDTHVSGNAHLVLALLKNSCLGRSSSR